MLHREHGQIDIVPRNSWSVVTRFSVCIERVLNAIQLSIGSTQKVQDLSTSRVLIPKTLEPLCTLLKSPRRKQSEREIIRNQAVLVMAWNRFQNCHCLCCLSLLQKAMTELQT